MKENEKIWAVKDGYLVHRDGSIYKLNWRNTGKMRKVKQRPTGTGYLQFSFHRKLTLVHRFVASCFIPNPDNLPCVNHKDENKQNNCADNLEWCDYKYNLNYGTHNKRMAESKSKKVYQYTKDKKFVREWVSTMEIKRVLGFANQAISACCNGKLKSAYDHLWYYEPLD